MSINKDNDDDHNDDDSDPVVFWFKVYVLGCFITCLLYITYHAYNFRQVTSEADIYTLNVAVKAVMFSLFPAIVWPVALPGLIITLTICYF